MSGDIGDQTVDDGVAWAVADVRATVVVSASTRSAMRCRASIISSLASQDSVRDGTSVVPLVSHNEWITRARWKVVKVWTGAVGIP
jgi:hypothetical protein